jgi:hypothetical protein
MAEKIGISFKETKDEMELLEWLKEKSKILGPSIYIKQLLYEKMLEEKKAAEK